MPYSIELSREAQKQLAALSDEELQQQISTAINELSSQPRPNGVSKIKGMTDVYRIRVRDYRVVYQIRDKQLLILVLRVKHRREAYR
ncbi:MAG: type II toxin-antitoxin system RelE/ParE family toxin [Timaviella obliquedivisa GSE-PSE-MK23-08B]|jgi:mRNA interferase RelE/StbE|nr:type II toxin-antitoxin system RelE/ParE family toxin [Timaviella obliquedivisa GSE-PSE-MK23-08B]MBW4514200.1 type II toxin-antitoxin system RelE/ParE family toxin [Timaviella obliquedivisa GSE-PSE-MK23-08B]